jgi:hypothetical protein
LIDRAGVEQGLGRAKDVLHGQQIAVAQRRLQRRQAGVGAQHEDAVVLGVGFDLVGIDGETAALRRFQIPPEAGVGEQRASAPGRRTLRRQRSPWRSEPEIISRWRTLA